MTNNQRIIVTCPTDSHLGQLIRFYVPVETERKLLEKRRGVKYEEMRKIGMQKTSLNVFPKQEMYINVYILLSEDESIQKKCKSKLKSSIKMNLELRN